MNELQNKHNDQTIIDAAIVLANGTKWDTDVKEAIEKINQLVEHNYFESFEAAIEYYLDMKQEKA